MKKYNINQTTLKILALYRYDYSAALHIREIARKISVDVKAVQLQLKMLTDLNVLLSQSKGKNKEYRLNLANHLTKYYLELAENYVTIVFLAENFEVKKIASETQDYLGGCLVLFGSFAKGEMTPESDMDLLVIDDQKVDTIAAIKAGKLIGRDLSIKVTAKQEFQQGLTDGDPLIREVVANHIILKGIGTIVDSMWRYYEKR